MLVSVIIPVLNEAEHIRATIAAARANYGTDEVEIIVVDGGSSDGTPHLLPPHVRLLHASRGRAIQMNRGVAMSKGQVLVFCHGDTRLPPGWRQPLLEALARPGVCGAAFRPRWWPERGRLLRLLNRLPLPAWWIVIFGDQVQCMTRATYDVIGGFPEIPLMEDLEMARALRARGRLVRIPLPVLTSSRRFLERGPLRQLLLDGWLTFRYLCMGVPAHKLAPAYRSARDEAFEGGSPQQTCQ